MTFTPARQPEGIPTGGQFAPTVHSDAVATLQAPTFTTYTAPLTGTLELTTASFDTLPEWPAGMPEPEVNFGFDDGKVETYVTVDGKMLTFWDSDGVGTINDTDTGGDNPWEDFDEEDQEAAVEWCKEVHARIDSATYGVMMEGSHSPAVKSIILAQALGEEPQTEKPGPDLTRKSVRDAYLYEAEARLEAANKELQNIYMIGAAQELRAKFPVIASFDLGLDDDDLLISGAWDADGNPVDDATISAASQEVFRYRHEDDFNTFTGQRTIDVEEAISFRPGA